MAKLQTQIRLSPELYAQVKEYAEKEVRSMNNAMEYLIHRGIELEKYIEKQKAEKE